MEGRDEIVLSETPPKDPRGVAYIDVDMSSSLSEKRLKVFFFSKWKYFYTVVEKTHRGGSRCGVPKILFLCLSGVLGAENFR